MESGDKCWKWRVFYVNPDDPAVFVRKRYGIGYTLNFGNRWSWVVAPTENLVRSDSAAEVRYQNARWSRS